MKPEQAGGWHKPLGDNETVELEQIESKHPTIENDLESPSKCENDFEKQNTDSDRSLQSPSVHSDGEALDQHFLVKELQMQSQKQHQKKSNKSASSTRDTFISLDTMSPPVRFYSHVRLASSLDHKAMMLAKGPDNYP